MSEEEIERASKVLDEHLKANPPSVAKPFPTLTEREREVALRLAVGDKNSEIGRALQISSKTVDTHRAHILKKLDLRNNVDLARHAIARGYVTLESENDTVS